MRLRFVRYEQPRLGFSLESSWSGISSQHLRPVAARSGQQAVAAMSAGSRKPTHEATHWTRQLPAALDLRRSSRRCSGARGGRVASRSTPKKAVLRNGRTAAAVLHHRFCKLCERPSSSPMRASHADRRRRRSNPARKATLRASIWHQPGVFTRDEANSPGPLLHIEPESCR